VFTAGSALCALAASSTELIAFRVLQGVGGGMLTPIGQMILVKAAGPRKPAEVMGIIGIPIVLAPVFGPTLGGLLLQTVGWQWIFLLNVPVGAIALTAALRLLPRDQDGSGDAGRLDLPAGAGRGRRGRRHLRPVWERSHRDPRRRLSAPPIARRSCPTGRVRRPLAAPGGGPRGLSVRTRHCRSRASGRRRD
jgi:MFS family permease